MKDTEFNGYLAKILSARYGEDVRNSIYNSIKGMNDNINTFRTSETDSVTQLKNQVTAAVSSATSAASNANSQAARASEAANQALQASNFLNTIMSENLLSIKKLNYGYYDENGTLHINSKENKSAGYLYTHIDYCFNPNEFAKIFGLDKNNLSAMKLFYQFILNKDDDYELYNDPRYSLFTRFTWFDKSNVSTSTEPDDIFSWDTKNAGNRVATQDILLPKADIVSKNYRVVEQINIPTMKNPSSTRKDALSLFVSIRYNVNTGKGYNCQALNYSPIVPPFTYSPFDINPNLKAADIPGLST